MLLDVLKSDLRPQPSTHATSQPIDIRRSSARPLNERRHEPSVERPKISRPVNRVKPVVLQEHAPELTVIPQLQAAPMAEANKENCNRMPAIYNVYTAAPSSSALRTDSNKLFDYMAATSPDCSCLDCSFEADENYHEDPLFPFPTEFRSIGDIIGWAKVVKAQRNETLSKFNSVMSTLRRDLQARTLRTAAPQLH